MFLNEHPYRPVFCGSVISRSVRACVTDIFKVSCARALSLLFTKNGLLWIPRNFRSVACVMVVNVGL